MCVHVHAKIESFCFWVPHKYQEDTGDAGESDVSENKNLEKVIHLEATGQTDLSYPRS